MTLTLNESGVREIGDRTVRRLADRLAGRSDDFEASGRAVLIGERSMIREYGSPENGARPFLIDEMVVPG